MFDSREQWKYFGQRLCECVCVQPEAISGSSRMKGGSATKILLEVVLSAAHAAALQNTPITEKGVLQHMRAYEKTLDITYAQNEGITALMEAAGQRMTSISCVYPH